MQSAPALSWWAISFGAHAAVLSLLCGSVQRPAFHGIDRCPLRSQWVGEPCTFTNMTQWLWDGPEDSDEEIEEMAQFKNAYEEELGIKFSKNGIKEFIDNLVERESA